MRIHLSTLTRTGVQCVVPDWRHSMRRLWRSAAGLAVLLGASVVYAVPSVTTITPTSGSALGGGVVTVTGAEFVVGATTVTVGGSACLAPFVQSSTSLTCIPPAGAVGASSVEVTTSAGRSPPNALYTYLTPTSGLVSIALGTEHTCAVAGLGTISCWGSNGSGQLGAGSFGGVNVNPAMLTGVGAVTAVAAGNAHSCALAVDGTVKCWGSNASGQLGDGGSVDRATPAPVTGLTGVVSVAAGANHTCAITTAGTVQCWGDNSTAQLGNGSMGGSSSAAMPVTAFGASLVVAVAAGTSHTCALAAGTVWCWGANTAGQLGTAFVGAYSPIPVPVSGVGSVLALTAGAAHTCALTSGGMTFCWGDNTYGQLGSGSFGGSNPNPTPVVSIGASVSAIAAGSHHTCAVTSIGGVRCWGRNNEGQLGDGNTADQPTPVNALGLANGVSVAAGLGGHTCALLGDGSVRCWGRNVNGQLGNGTVISSHVPLMATSVPGAPTGASATPGNVSLSVSFLAPSSNGGINIDGYRVTCGGVSVVGMTSPITVTGLVNGTSYACTVAARNGLGWSDESIAAASVAPATVPDAPTGITATPGNASVAVGFMAPLSNGGAAIDSYRATCGGNVITGSISPITVTGLGNGLGVSCTVAAHNSAGWSVESAPSATVTPRAPPNVAMVSPVNGSTMGGTVVTLTGTDFIPGATTVTIGGVACLAPYAASATSLTCIAPPGVAGDASVVATTSYGSSGASILFTYAAPAGAISAIAAGVVHSCAVTSAGTVWCWGLNTNGQLGNGSNANSAVPVQASGLTGVTAVSGGADHTCALVRDGTVQCWGANSYGSLGTGGGVHWTPAPVVGLSGVISIATGAYFTCAVTTAGAVYCWGYNYYGQLGTGNTTSSPVPVSVTGMTDVVSVRAGYSHACALSRWGTVSCWGMNAGGELGAGMAVTQSAVPVPVLGLGVATSLAVGISHACVRQVDGAVRCWGRNSNGQLGSNSYIAGTTTAVISGLTGAVDVGAGEGHTCALINDGTVRCLGQNSTYGQLGNGTFVDSGSPVLVSGLTGAAKMAVGSAHACVVVSDGTVQCWGSNLAGELGNGTTTNSPVPVHALLMPSLPQGVTVTGGNASITVAFGAPAFAGLTSVDNYRVTCNGVSITGSSSPIAFSSLANGTSYTCTVAAHNSVGWSAETPLSAAVTPALPPTVSAVSPVSGSTLGGTAVTLTGTNFVAGTTTVTIGGAACLAPAVRSSTSLTCVAPAGAAGAASVLASNGAGNSGAGTSYTYVAANTTTASVNAGAAHTCVVSGLGTVQCWGDNSSGQLGDGTTTGSSRPVAVGGLGGVVAVAAGFLHTCALTNGGTVTCWGKNSGGQLGNGNTTDSPSPVPVSGLSGVTRIAAGGAHTCALTTAGTVYCWGIGTQGELGNGQSGASVSSSTPVAVVGLGGLVADIAAGDAHVCALTTSGSVQCWGNSTYGQLGNGTSGTGALSATPVTVQGVGGGGTTLTGVVGMAAGGMHTCVTTASAAVRCWGLAQYGQLGNGVATTGALSATPVAVLGMGGTGNLSGVTNLVVGMYHSCALTSTGAALCWGYNAAGQLGNGTVVNSAAPTAVLVASGGAAVSGVLSIAAGGYHTCALTSTTGTVQCWGLAQYGELGNGVSGSNAYSASPVRVLFTPPTPTIGNATAGNASVSVGFTANSVPAGNPPSDNYRATCTASGSATSLSAVASASPITVPNLTNGVSYTCTVAAHNSDGWSSESAASVAVTPNLTQTISPGSIPTLSVGGTATLTASATSGLPVSYTVAPASVVVCSVSGSIVSGLSAGLCTIYVDQGGNAGYLPAPRVTLAFSVTAVAPGAPTVGSITAGPGIARIVITPPASTGGAPIASYTATCTAAGQPTRTGSGGTSPLIVSGLKVGVPYSCSVTASNGTASSASSAATTVTLTRGPDSTPILMLLLD